jgi:hypothetical protein
MLPRRPADNPGELLGLIYPGPAVRTQGVTGTRGSTGWLVGAGVDVGCTVAVRWQCQCRGAEAARRESQHDNPAPHPGANRSCRRLRVSATRRSAGPNDVVP